jgi:hypothetical protein
MPSSEAKAQPGQITHKPPVIIVEKNKVLDSFLQLVQADSCTENMTLDFSWRRLDTEGMRSLATALASGKCKNGLAIDLSRNFDMDLTLLLPALESGKCPANMKISLINNNILSAAAKKLAEAIKSEKFPQGCSIDLSGNTYIGSIMAKELNEAAANSPAGVKIIMGPNPNLLKILPPPPPAAPVEKVAVKEDKPVVKTEQAQAPAKPATEEEKENEPETRRRSML